jgi:ankyrin repeat protein
MIFPAIDLHSCRIFQPRFFQVVEYLLSKSKDIEVNAVDDTDKTALHHAARRQMDDV